MRIALRRVIGLSAALILGSAMAVAVGGPPASASAAQGYVSGTGVITDDFDEESNLSNGGSYSISNYAALWQAVMWADGVMPWIDVDCNFGPQTAAYTRQWHQKVYGTSSSVMDSQARLAIERSLQPDGASSDGDYVRYYGLQSGRTIRFHRHGGSYSSPYIYDMQSPADASDWHGVWYNTTNFKFCG